MRGVVIDGLGMTEQEASEYDVVSVDLAVDTTPEDIAANRFKQKFDEVARAMSKVSTSVLEYLISIKRLAAAERRNRIRTERRARKQRRGWA
jgi:hypothetical protein